MQAYLTLYPDHRINRPMQVMFIPQCASTVGLPGFNATDRHSDSVMACLYQRSRVWHSQIKRAGLDCMGKVCLTFKWI